MSLAQGSNSIAAGAAISVDRNESTVDIYSDLIAENSKGERGDIDVSAVMTQNMDGEYKGLLAAQAVAGAVSGAGTATLAGSIAVVVDEAVTAVRIHDGTENDPLAITGASITFTGYD